MDRLKAPKTSELSRKRKVLSNPPKGKKKSSGSSALKTRVNIHPTVRVNDFPGEELSVSMGKLFCKACRETLSVKQSSVKSHIKSVKHVNSKAKLKVKISREQNLTVYLKKYDENVHPNGETLPTEQRVYHIKVLKIFMRAGVPISKLEYFRDILEENALWLTERSHMLDFVPFVLEEEKSCIKEEINGKHLSITEKPFTSK